MATIRVYLDTRRMKSNGEYPVKIVINHRKDIMISTDYSASKSQWKDGEFTRLSTNYKSKNANLLSKKLEIEKKILDLERDNLLFRLTDKDYDGFKRGVNYALKKLSDDSGIINDKLSTYTGRHSCATIAASLDIPKETISAALGHSIGSEITSIYINFDMKKVDQANRRVIDCINA